MLMRRLMLLLMGGLLGSLCWAESVIYPRHQAAHDPQIDYVLSVLKLALEKSGQPYQLRQSDLEMVQSRAIIEIKNNSGKVDVLWSMTTPEREAELLPIRIPIDRGLIGWRLALVKSSMREQFAKVNSLGDLAPFIAGQMHDWPDTAILRHNGLKVLTSSIYEGLFNQLSKDRIDYFPRSVIEIQNELASHRDLELAIEPHLIIKYPTAFYFFVSRKRPELGRDLEVGLEKALADGSFEQVFKQHFGKLVNELGLAKRKVLELENPLLPKETPLSRSELWFK